MAERGRRAIYSVSKPLINTWLWNVGVVPGNVRVSRNPKRDVKTLVKK
jgi:hypothetical protein